MLTPRFALAAFFGLVGTSVGAAQPPDRLPHGDGGPWNHQIHVAFSENGLDWEVVRAPILKQASVPDIIELSGAGQAGKKGTLVVYAVDVSRQIRDGEQEGLSRLTSADGGKTWGKPESLKFDRVPTDGKPVDPSVVQLPDGRLRLFCYAMGRAEANGEQRHRFYSFLSEDGLHFKREEGARVEGFNITDPEVIKVGERWFMFISRGPETLLATSDDGLTFKPDGKFLLEGGGVPGALPLADGRIRVYQCGHGITSVIYDPKTGQVDREHGVRIDGAADPAVQPLAAGGYVMVLKTWMQPIGPRREEPGGYENRFQDRPVARSPAEQLRMMWGRGQAEKNGLVRLETFPLRLNDIQSIGPMGLMVGGHVTPSDHLGLQPTQFGAGSKRFEVVAPAAGYVVDIQRATGNNPDPTVRDKKAGQYRVVVEHSGTFWSWVGLIDELDPALLTAIGGEPQPGPPVQMRVPVKAGQVLGTMLNSHGIDFLLIDTDVKLKGFINPDQFLRRDPWKLHAADPFNYVDEPLKSKLLALNARKAEPRGGKIDYDIDGRLAGNWYREGTGGYAGLNRRLDYWVGHLAFVYHYIATDRIVVSLGDYDGRPQQFGVKGNGPDPAKIGVAEGLVKYGLIAPTRPSSATPFADGDGRVQAVVLVQLVEERRLKVEVFPGKTAEEVKGFTERAGVYER